MLWARHVMLWQGYYAVHCSTCGLTYLRTPSWPPTCHTGKVRRVMGRGARLRGGGARVLVVAAHGEVVVHVTHALARLPVPT